MRRAAIGLGLIREDGEMKLNDWRVHAFQAGLLALLGALSILGDTWRNDRVLQTIFGVLFLCAAVGQAWFSKRSRRLSRSSGASAAKRRT
jgi:hypothetical protein